MSTQTNAQDALHPVIRRAVERYDVSPHIADEYQALFEKCHEWFTPTNRHDDEYSRAQVLHSLGLLDQRKTALHRNGMFRGFRVEFQHSDFAGSYEGGAR